ncbi:unnamed protein product [Schistosoma mattheei]|uniref:Uncharacterized protein n=1 Tax=Schistosoma mattheei TaxID=31246 RepID=A0A183NDH9_9TREM|nr:unnamed protein product [Schistosoma mattheei]
MRILIRLKDDEYSSQTRALCYLGGLFRRRMNVPDRLSDEEAGKFLLSQLAALVIYRTRFSIKIMSGRGKGGKVRSKANTKSSRADLQFLVGRVDLLRKGNYAEIWCWYSSLSSCSSRIPGCRSFGVSCFMIKKLHAFVSGLCCEESNDNPMFQEVLLPSTLYLQVLRVSIMYVS